VVLKTPTQKELAREKELAIKKGLPIKKDHS
jgi:hypothetical protein